MFGFLLKHATASIAWLAVGLPFLFTDLVRGQAEFAHLNHFRFTSSQPQPLWGQGQPGNGTLFDQGGGTEPAFANDPANSASYGQEIGAGIDDSSGRYSLRTFGGWNFSDGNQDVNRGWALGGAAGRYIRPNSRIEMEFTYRHNAGNQSLGVVGNLNSYSLLSNLMLELPALRVVGLTPYVGGGVGLSLINGSLEEDQVPVSVDDPAFAYQGIVGASRKIGKGAEIFGEYRYFGTTNVDLKFPTGIDRAAYSAENVLIGLQLRY